MITFEAAQILKLSKIFLCLWRCLIISAVAAFIAFSGSGSPSDARPGQNPYEDISKIREKQARREITFLKSKGVGAGDVQMLPALRELADALGGLIRMDEHIKVLEEIIELDNRFPKASSAEEKAKSLSQLANYKRGDESAALLEKALKIAVAGNMVSHKTLVDLHSRLGHYARLRRDFKSAETHYRAVDTVSGGMEKVVDADELLGFYNEALTQLKEYQRATSVLKRLVALDRSRPSRYRDRILPDKVRLAWSLLDQKRIAEFERESDSIIQMAEEQISRRYGSLSSSWRAALADLGELLEKEHQMSRAEKAYRLCLRCE